MSFLLFRRPTPCKSDRFLALIQRYFVALTNLTTADTELGQFRHYLEHTNWMAAAAIAVALAGGASRGLALYYNYGAPINTWMHVREEDTV